MKTIPKSYLKNLAEVLEKQLDAYQTPEQKLMMLSGAKLNWIGDIISDKSIKWTKENLNIDKLYLTGTNPRWNKIIIDFCGRSPIKLRALLLKNKSIATVFKTAKFSSVAILVRHDGDKYKILDGMKRVIAAILLGKKTINAYVALPNGKLKPQCEPHVVYDLLRAYQRGINKDRKSLVIALRFLRKGYSNVDDLLRYRFDKKWLPNEVIQKIIREALH